MERDETTSCLETDRESPQGDLSRALVSGVAYDEKAAPQRRYGGRPLAPFLTQLILSADPSLCPTRLERTRAAADRYAQSDRRQEKRRA